MGIDSRSLGPMHLSGNLNYEIQRSNNFQVEIYGLPGAGTEQIMLATESWGLPTVTNSAITINHGNSGVHYAGKAEFSGADTLVIVDYITQDVEKIINEWRKQVYDPETDKIGWAANYKKEGVISMFGPDGTVIRDHKLKGLWPESVSWGDTVSYEGNDVKKVTMTLRHDKSFLQR